MGISVAKNRREIFWAGMKAELPLLIGVMPFGMIYGALAVQAGLTAWQSQAMSWMIFAGSSQFVAAELFSQTAPMLVIVMTVLVMNLRHLFYSASISPFLQKASIAWKLLLGYLLTDEAYGVAIVHFQKEGREPDPNDYHYLFGAGLILWLSWQISTALGILFGLYVPSDWSLDFALSITFIALLVPMLKDKPALMAAVSAGITAVVLHGMPYKLDLVVATIIGILCGVLTEKKK